MRKVYIVGGNNDYLYFIDDAEEVHIMEDADIVVFTGGEDVTPTLYGENPHQRTLSNIKRDRFESQEWWKAVSHQKPVVGICRGSQLITVMSGGKLVQDVTGHSMYGTHEIEMGLLRNKYRITSTHHQMMNPYQLKADEYDVLAVASPSRSNIYAADNETFYNMPAEPEIVYYPYSNALAIQGHPEQMDKSEPIVRQINLLINKMISNGSI